MPLRARHPTTREQIAAVVKAVAPKPVNVLFGRRGLTVARYRRHRRSPHQRRRRRWRGPPGAGSSLAAAGIARGGRFDAFAKRRPFADINNFFRVDHATRAQGRT